MDSPQPDQNYVYHGSHEIFDVVAPKKQVRIRDGKEIFNEISFHATPYKWIALAYTCIQKPISLNGKKTNYMMGVSLYNHALKVDIFGIESLERSLEEMYGQGGYLYVFDKKDFYHTEGLGNLEVITKDPIKPIRVDKIDNPIEEMKKERVKFNFIDLTLAKNAEYWFK